LTNGSTPGEEIHMPVKCPSCNLLFGTRNELDWHVREEHLQSRLPARTPPAEDGTTPTHRAAPVTGDARAGPDGPPLPPEPAELDTADPAPSGRLAWLRRLLRPSGSRRLSEPQQYDQQR
jgi:hypothetical protein